MLLLLPLPLFIHSQYLSQSDSFKTLRLTAFLCHPAPPQRTSLTFPPFTLSLIHTLDSMLFLQLFRDTPAFGDCCSKILFLQISAQVTPSPVTSYNLCSHVTFFKRPTLIKLVKADSCVLPPCSPSFSYSIYLLFRYCNQGTNSSWLTRNSPGFQSPTS